MSEHESLFQSRYCYFPDCVKGERPEWCGDCEQREITPTASAWPEGGLPHGEHSADYVSDRVIWKFVPESGDTARTPDASVRTIERATTDAGASSPGRSLIEIRATGAAWIAESEIARICDAVNEAETLTSRAHDVLYAEPFDRKAASDAIWKIHDVLRGLRDGG